MIITFATQKGGVGKTTLAVAFANYLTITKKEKVKVFDFDLFFSEGAQYQLFKLRTIQLGEHTKGETYHGKRHSKVV